MKLAVTCCSHDHLVMLLEDDLALDSFLIGESFLSRSLPYTYDLATLLKTITQIAQYNKEVFIDVRAVITNELLSNVQTLLEQLDTVATLITGIVFADPAVYMEAKKLGMTVPLIWGDDMINTNWYDSVFWAEKGVKQTVVSRELTKKAIESINTHIATQDNSICLHIQGFGALGMFHSRRNLVSNYFNQLEKVQISHTEQQQLFLYDRERLAYYPIVEDVSGTHIFSPKDMCIVDELDFLADLSQISYLWLDANFHTPSFMQAVYETFITARNMLVLEPEEYFENKKKFVELIASIYPTDAVRTMDKGFFYKPTIY